MEIVPKKQVKHCKIKGELAGRKQTFEAVVYQNREFIRIKTYTQQQIINIQKSQKKFWDSNIPAIIIKEKQGYSLWILFKSLVTQKHLIDSESDFIRVSVKQQPFNQFKALAIVSVIPLIGTVLIASEMRLSIDRQTIQECKRIESDCPEKIKALEKLTKPGSSFKPKSSPKPKLM